MDEVLGIVEVHNGQVALADVDIQRGVAALAVLGGVVQLQRLQCVEYGNGGIGYYCYGGKCEKIYWQKGTPLEALRLYYLDENGQCSDTPCEINIGKSYVSIVDVDEAINFKSGLLADFDLDAATVSASNTSIDADAEEGESLNVSTDDLTNAARGSEG